jgi:hypothetical protein
VITSGRRQLHRSVPRAAAVVTLGLVALSLTGPAAAATCGKRVIDDWYADGRVDGTYALHCYDDAIEALPRDVRDYSSAKEDIERAMQAAMRGEDPPTSTTETGGGSGSSGSGGPSDPTPTTPGTTEPDPADTPGETGVDEEAAAPVDTAASDSVPLPLLVLGGLALLLIAAGSLGYLVRRVQARRIPPASL